MYNNLRMYFYNNIPSVLIQKHINSSLFYFNAKTNNTLLVHINLPIIIIIYLRSVRFFVNVLNKLTIFNITRLE